MALIPMAEVLLGFIERQEVEACDTSSLCASFQELLRDKSALELFAGRIQLLFDGYLDDPRALFEIPEVRAFVQAFDCACPHWMWLAEPETVRLLTQSCCAGSMARVGEQYRWVGQPAVLAPFVEAHIDALGELESRYGMSDSLLQQAAYRIWPILGFPSFPKHAK